MDVAKLAGVSIATVSRTINNKDRVTRETRERVRRAIDKTGFSPNALARRLVESIANPLLAKAGRVLSIRRASVAS